METFFYYFREAMGLVPLLLLYWCLLYMVTIYKGPESLPLFLGQPRRLLGRVQKGVLFVSFCFCTFAGGGRLVLETDLVSSWGEEIRMLFVIMPLGIASVFVAGFMIGLGMEAHEQAVREQRERELKQLRTRN